MNQHTVPPGIEAEFTGAGVPYALQDELLRLRMEHNAMLADLRRGRISDALMQGERCGRILGGCIEIAGIDE